MSEDQKNTNEQAKNEDQGQQSAAASSGSTGLIANVDVAYKKDDDTYGYARGFEYFETSEEDAEGLVAQNKAQFAKEGENGGYTVDEEKTSQFKNDAAIQQDRADSEASQEAAENQPARWMNSATGMLGRDANESNNMPGDADELTGRYTDAGNRNREAELHENAGVSRIVG